MTIPLRGFDPPPRSTPPPPKRRSVFGKAVRGVGWLAAAPLDWIGTRRIGRSASFIRELLSVVRSGQRRDNRFKTQEFGGFDLEATAFSYGLSVAQLEARMATRRRQTARIAYAALALAMFFLATWLWRALASPWTATRLASAIEFLPFCVLFFLVAFYNALLNFQVRTGRTVGWREYLSTDLPFWPR